MTALGLELLTLPAFPSVEAFYADDERRRYSPEWDYGVHWRPTPDGPTWPRWRVSWVVRTGELYALRLAGADELLLVLGHVAPVGEYPIAAAGGLDGWHRFHRDQDVERLLDGWALVDPLTLDWILARLRGAEA